MRNFALALLIMIIPSCLLGGCGMIHLPGLSVIEEPDGVEVQNVTSEFDIRVHKIGGLRQMESPLIRKGDPTIWVVDTKNLNSNFGIEVTIVVSAFRHGEFVGEARRKYGVPSNRATNDFWAVHDSDLQFRSADHDCP